MNSRHARGDGPPLIRPRRKSPKFLAAELGVTGRLRIHLRGQTRELKSPPRKTEAEELERNKTKRQRKNASMDGEAAYLY